MLNALLAPSKVLRDIWLGKWDPACYQESELRAHIPPHALKSTVTQDRSISKALPGSLHQQSSPRKLPTIWNGNCNIPASFVSPTAGGRVTAALRTQAPSIFPLRHPCLCPIRGVGRGLQCSDWWRQAPEPPRPQACSWALSRLISF